MLYDALKKLTDNQRKPAMDHYLDEETGQIKSRPLSQKDMAASALTHREMIQYRNPAKLIHDLVFAR